MADDQQRLKFSLFPNFGFKFPFAKNGSKSEETSLKPESASVDGGDEVPTEKPHVVRLPRKPLEAPPLKFEAVEESGKTSNPLILWQVYAVGGFLVLRWFWGRWKERQEKKHPDNDDDGDDSPDGYHSPTEGLASD